MSDPSFSLDDDQTLKLICDIRAALDPSRPICFSDPENENCELPENGFDNKNAPEASDEPVGTGFDQPGAFGTPSPVPQQTPKSANCS